MRSLPNAIRRKSDSTRHRMTATARLPRSLKVFHGLGSVAYGIKDNGFSVFLLIFYNQVMGLDAGVVGTVIMAALIFDAFADPIIGELSDRTQSRWGRRLPWLYFSAVPARHIVDAAMASACTKRLHAGGLVVLHRGAGADVRFDVRGAINRAGPRTDERL